MNSARPGSSIIHRPVAGLKAIVVIDNTACGPAVGGVRMAPDVSAEECFRLARAMTWKNAAAGLPHGGGKSVIFGDPRMPPADKEQIMRAFADAIRDIADYIPGPDMGTDELCMGWIKDETGRAVGLPAAVGGIPLDEIGATGFGAGGLRRRGARLHRARAERRAHRRAGLRRRSASTPRASSRRRAPARRRERHQRHPGRSGRPRRRRADRAQGIRAARCAIIRTGRSSTVDAIIDVDCDIWIPAARPDVVRADNVRRA